MQASLIQKVTTCETPDCQTGINCLEYTQSEEKAPGSWRIPVEHPNPVSAQ